MNKTQVVDLHKEIDNQDKFIQFSITIPAKDLLEKLADEMAISGVDDIDREVAIEFLECIHSYVYCELTMEICNEAEYHANAIIQGH